jgi:hypothetical protein
MSTRMYFVLDGPTEKLGDILQTLKDTFGFASTPEFRATFVGSWFTCVVALAQRQSLQDVQNALMSFTYITIQ